MFSITVSFRSSRSRGDKGKPGIVFYRIARHGLNEQRIERCVNSDIKGADESVLQTEREKIISQLRLLYCVIERREGQGEPCTIDDVVNDFRKALLGEESMADVRAKSRIDFPLRRDIVSIGREFKGAFQYVFSAPAKETGENLSEFVFGLTQSLKNARRNSQAHSFASLLSSLREFVKTDEIKFADIDAGFVRDYAGWLKQTGITESTQSFYLRTLRTILNKAQKDGLVEASSEWFLDVNTRIYKTSDFKDKKLSRDVILKIENLDLPSNGPLALVRDMFMFGFYCEGMELVDIANLTTENIKDGLMVYRRRQKGVKKVVVLGREAKKIIKRYISPGQHYLFPLLRTSDHIMFSSVSNYVRQYLKTIGEKVGFPQLTFSMNIGAYKSLMSSVNVSELLLKHTTDNVLPCGRRL